MQRVIMVSIGMRASVLILLISSACTIDPPPARIETTRCFELSPSPGIEVARVGRTALTMEQIRDRIEAEGQAAIRRFRDPKRLHEFVEDLIRFELMAFAALERDLHRDPDVIEAARKVMVQKLLDSDLSGDALGVDVAEKEIQRYYKRHRGYYIQPAMRRVAHIQLEPTDAGRSLATRLIQQTAERPADVRFFRQLVQDHSLDHETLRRGGEYLFKTEEELEDKFGLSFAREVFAHPTDDFLQAPVQSTKGWHVVKVVSRRRELLRSLEEVRSEIVEKLLAKRRARGFDRYLMRLREKHPVVLHDERVLELAKTLGDTE